MKRLFVFIQMLIAFVSGVSAQTAPAGYSEVANWTEGFENFASTIKPNPGLGWAYIDGGFVESTWTTMFSKNSSYYATGSYSLGITNTATSAAVNYLVTPAIKGQVKMQARALSYSSSYEGTQYIKFYKVTKNEDGTFSVPTEEDLLATEDLGLNNTFHEIAPLNLSEYTYVAITGSRAYIDDFTADYALMPENPALQVTAISSEWSDNNPLYADATGKFTWTGKFKVKNAGNVDLVADRDNYSVTVTSQSTSKITIPETIIPISVDLAQGQESEEFELSLECQLVDITAVESRTAFRVTSNLVEYGKTNTNSDYYKQSSWFTAKSSNPSLDVRNANGNKMEDTKFDLGLVAGSGSHTFKVYNVGGSDAVITAIESTIPEGFSHNAALPLTIAKGESADVALTIGGAEGYKEGTVTFTYGDGFTYTTKNISATVIPEGTYLETFGTELTPAKTYVPGGWINQAGSNWEAAASSYNIHMKNTVQQYPTAMLVSPKITFAEGQNLTVGVTSQTTSFWSSTDAYLQVYYSTDRQNWQLANVITYNDTKKSATEDINGNAIDANKIIEWGSLNGTTVDKIKAYTIDGIPAGDYYIGFRSGYALIDYIFGGQLANVENDLYIDNFTVNPGKAMVNYDATASVTYRNMSDKAAAAHTVALYDGETLIEEKAGADLAAYASSTVDFTFTPRAAGEMNLKAVVKNVEGEYSVESEVSTINIVAETFTADALVGTHTKTYDRYTPIRTYDKNSKSEWIWTKEVLGLDNKTAITSVAFPYYNTDKDVTAEHFAFYLVNIDEEKDDFASADAWTDLSELTPAFEATNYTLKKAGTSSDPALLTLSLAEPFVYTGGNVKGIMLIEKQNTYSSYYFEYNSDNNLFSSIYTSSDNYDTYKGANPTRKQQYPVATLSLAVQAPVLSGTITAEEVALEGATVEAKSGNVIYTATTDAEGKYSMEIMQPTLEYVVTVSAEGYESFVSEAMTIAENTTLDTDLQVATPATVTVSINPAIGYATFYDSKHAVKIPEGAVAYAFTQTLAGGLGLVEYSEILSSFPAGDVYEGVIPAGEAIVIKAEGDVTLECVADPEYAVLNALDVKNFSEVGFNFLNGTDEPAQTTAPEWLGESDDDCYFYALTLNAANDPKSVGFYWMNSTGAAFENNAHKAYLAVPKYMFETEDLVKKAYRFIDDDATAISSAMKSENGKQNVYNLNGQRVNENAKGIVIKNGRKYIIK